MTIDVYNNLNPSPFCHYLLGTPPNCLKMAFQTGFCVSNSDTYFGKCRPLPIVNRIDSSYLHSAKAAFIKGNEWSSV